ncbi:DUF3040 domain-containing protein [Nonomuraea fuscirosea]|uniref:DUF3040 domain-containing protein n=1 Tax=Nonomuraea fuscirosea TaxID=1291556 RepID=UPI002DDB58FB|nr:DUF3040 domain-containing protein [Nonomuraea fuscirosea]WSA58228.1 DUF3040 domain-containing protein [Nonomuraea fuscirosea]
MELSDRERRILGEIERDLRREDRAFVRRVESFDAACRRRETRRSGGRSGGRYEESSDGRSDAGTSGREIWYVLLVVIFLATLPILLVLLAGHAGAPAVPPVPAPGLTAGIVVPPM